MALTDVMLQLILSMRSKIAELKGYSVEPANSQVLRGVFELLGDAHKDIKSWGDCRKRLSADLFTRITEFDASVKPMKRLAAVSKIKSSIEGVEQAAVNTSSEALGGMYTWLTAALEAIEAAASASVTAGTLYPSRVTEVWICRIRES